MQNVTSTSPPDRPTVALLGAGAMGAAIAERLLDQGFAVRVWNRTPGPATRLAERGATAYARPDQAVDRADVVVTMLPTADVVRDVMLQQRTLDFARPGTVWAQMGTIGVEATESLAAEVERAYPDITFVDAPVSGSREPARSGRLLILASGPDRAQSIVEPVFQALGRPVWLGEAGKGSRIKLVLNTWLAFEVEAAAEVAALADRLDVTHAALRDVVTGGPLASGVALTKLAKMESADFSPDFSLEWALKDLDLARASAGDGVIPVAGAIAERWRSLVSAGYGPLDISAARMDLGPSHVAATREHAS
jgi:3-hydroxyisobutyrate dehydrogenase